MFYLFSLWSMEGGALAGNHIFPCPRFLPLSLIIVFQVCVFKARTEGPVTDPDCMVCFPRACTRSPSRPLWGELEPPLRRPDPGGGVGGCPSSESTSEHPASPPHRRSKREKQDPGLKPYLRNLVNVTVELLPPGGSVLWFQAQTQGNMGLLALDFQSESYKITST